MSIDTAGLRQAADIHDEVERIGIERSWGAIARADAVILLHDLTRRGQPAYEAREAAIERAVCQRPGSPRACTCTTRATPRRCAADERPWWSRARRGDGLDALRARAAATGRLASIARGVFIARARHVQALQRAAQHVGRAQAHGDRRAMPRSSCWPRSCGWPIDALGEITGVFTTDDLLGEIFGRFCIGK